MLGWLRLVLALWVLLAHVGGEDAMSHLGRFAVFGFYLVSGYLMTAVLHGPYRFDLRSFAVNRALRIYPAYAVVAVVTLVTILVVPGASDYHPSWRLRARLVDVLGNTLLVPFEYYDQSFRLVPPAWSLGVELTNYVLLWLVVARTRRTAVTIATGAAAYHVVSMAIGMRFDERYAPSYAALLPFAIGALIWFSQRRIGRRSGLRLASGCAVVWVANAIWAGVHGGFGGVFYDGHFYLNLLALSGMMWAIHHVGDPFRREGMMAGDLAYPVFLVHWLVAFWVSVAVLDRAARGWELVALALGPILAVSYVMVWLTRRYLDPIRLQVRQSAPGAGSADERAP